MTKVKEESLDTRDKQTAQRLFQIRLRELQQESVGIIRPKAERDAAQRDLSEHLADLIADLKVRGCSEKHIANISHRVGVLIKECGWSCATDVTADSFVSWRSGEKLAAKTLNDYLSAISSLLNWMKDNRRILDNPLSGVDTIDTTGRKTFERRASTDEEIRRLIAIAGIYKAVYLMAVYTGLRRSELKKLLWGDLRLDATVPWVHLRPEITKNGKEASIPLHPDVVSALRELKNGQSNDGAPVFVRIPRIERFRRDLKKAGVEYKDSQGRVADFHALRMTFDTNLQRNGIQPRVVMELMRHSDIRQTMKTYTDASRLPTEDAIKSLPSFNPQ